MKYSFEQGLELVTKWNQESIPVGVLGLSVNSGLWFSLDGGVIGLVTASGFRVNFSDGWLIFPLINAQLEYLENTEPAPADFPDLANYLSCLVIRHDSGENCVLFEMWPDTITA
jgi:hypothetical protein